MKNRNYYLTPPELKAIEEHKYYMSIALKREVSIEEAIEDFLKNHSHKWRCYKQKSDNEEQYREVERYKYFRSQEMGYDIGSMTAFDEWAEKFAKPWREYRESLEKNGFIHIKAVLKNKKGLHMRPCGMLSNIASKFDCDVYVHKKNMEYYSFILNEKEYINVKSALSLLTVAAIQNDELEFIATGRQAPEALAAIVKLIDNQFCE